MKRILFVDDDVPVLEGLRLRLRPQQGKWSMHFVASGALVLTAFQEQPFDMVVSDVRMPGVQGSRLLRTVSERWPEAIRIALSGVTDPKETLHLVPIAHQFLSKPCEPTLLEDTIERCLALQDFLPDPHKRAMVGRVRRLPPQRHAYKKLLSLLSDPRSTVTEIAAVIASDSVLAAVAQLVSSAFFRRSTCALNIEEAISHLGLDMIRSVVTTVEIFSQWPEKPLAQVVNLDSLQRHSRTVADIARALGSLFARAVGITLLDHRGCSHSPWCECASTGEI